MAKCVVFYYCFADGWALELAVKIRLRFTKDDLVFGAGKKNRKAAGI